MLAAAPDVSLNSSAAEFHYHNLRMDAKMEVQKSREAEESVATYWRRFCRMALEIHVEATNEEQATEDQCVWDVAAIFVRNVSTDTCVSLLVTIYKFDMVVVSHGGPPNVIC